MEEVILRAELDDSTSLYVSPIDRLTYDEYVDSNSLGGADGYFVFRSRSVGMPRLEILAKAATLEAASDLFDLIVVAQRRTA